MILLKVPQNLIQVANQKKQLNIVMFWYCVKSLNRQGSVSKTDFPALCVLSGLSEQSVHKNLLKCVKLGIAFRNGLDYGLCKYDALWEFLGYHIPETRLKVFYNGYKQPILEVSLKEVAEAKVSLKDYVSYQVLKSNVRNQEYVVKEKLRKSLLDAGYRCKVVRRILKNLTLNKVSKIIQQQFTGINFTITLSYKRISELCGYQSIKSAYDLVQRLKNAKFIKVKRRIVKSTDYPNSSSYFIFKYKVYKSLPNLYSFIM